MHIVRPLVPCSLGDWDTLTLLLFFLRPLEGLLLFIFWGVDCYCRADLELSISPGPAAPVLYRDPSFGCFLKPDISMRKQLKPDILEGAKRLSR